MIKTTSLSVLVTLALAGCASVSVAPSDQSVEMVKGPVIVDIETEFDRALICLAGRTSPNATFSVGAIVDSTGKEQFTEGGTGKFITQGAGEIVQSALFSAGVTLLNRRDPRVLEAEVKWGIRQGKSVIPSKYFVTGSINSLDFIPGAGFDVQVAGVGPRYRQYRILVGLDLSVTETATGRIVANSSMQKQIFADELGFGIGRFFGDVLVNLDAANLRREATSLALRQMLNLATYDLLTQLMRQENYVDCSEGIKEYHKVNISKSVRMSRASTGPNGTNSKESLEKKDASGAAQPTPEPREKKPEDVSGAAWSGAQSVTEAPAETLAPEGGVPVVPGDVESKVKTFDVR